MGMARSYGVGTALVVSLALLLAAPGPLAPAVIVVDAGCSLADAITSANSDSAVGGCTAGSGADDLQVTGDVTLAAALPIVDSEISIQGNGFTIARDDAAPAFRIFEVGADVTFSIDSATLSNGDAGSGGGGAIAQSSSGLLTLSNSTLSGNTADRGGALYSSWFEGSTILVDTTVSDNSARVGGGIWNYGSLYLISSTVSENSADEGGGIYGAWLVNVAENSRISGNTATGAGGGILFDGYGVGTVSGSTISYNVAGAGGAIFMSDEIGSLDYQSITIADSALFGNTAGGDGGGAVLNGGSYDGGNMVISNTTISGNSATRGGGILHVSGDHLALENSTLAENSAAQGSALHVLTGELALSGSIVARGSGGAACEGQPVSAGAGSFDTDGSCGQAGPITPGVDFDTDLGANGGPTRTHALLPGSVAIDAAGDCGLETDQRGFPRNDGFCDSGAVEFGFGLLSLTGECPGTMTLRANSAIPNTQLEIFRGPAAGSSQVPSGVCAGTELDITNPESVALFATDQNGDGATTVDFVAADCGQLVQGVVEADCSTTNLETIDSCDRLALSRTGSGANPVAVPTSSAGCPAKEYLGGELVSLTAAPDPSWIVGGWTGTDDDASTDLTNTVTMPAGDHAALVDYARACRSLTVDRTGQGAVPVASPANSPGCSAGEYLPGEMIDLSGADPAPDWAVLGWTGTDDDSSTDSNNRLTMPAFDHTATVNYFRICFNLRVRHTGSGSDPVASPASSPGCSPGAFNPGEVVELTATPDDGWRVVAWSGTDDDSSTSTINTRTMPADDVVVEVTYQAICYSLSVSHTGAGSDPIVVPTADGTTWIGNALQSDFRDALGVFAADLDGDGDLDVLGSSLSEDEVAWWKNVAGDGSSWVRQTLASGVAGPATIYVADIDGDGDPDVVVADLTDDEVSWWENVAGDGSSWLAREVGVNIDSPAAVSAVDMDGDGDQDVLVASFLGDFVAWFENRFGDGSSWARRLVDDSLPQANFARAADLDGDGDMDVVGTSTSTFVDKILWWENVTGDGSSWVEHDLSGFYDNPSSSVPADIDGDGDMDVVATGWFADAVRWWENAAGDGSSWTEHSIGEQFDGANWSHVEDVDGDGDLDVIASANHDDKVAWFENRTGTGETWEEHVVSNSFIDAEAVFAADLDGDADVDIQGVSDDSGIAWWQNVYGGDCAAGQYNVGDRLALTAAPAAGWEVAGWAGTDDNVSTSTENVVTMPAADHAVAVDYIESPSPITVSATGVCPGEIEVSVSADPLESIILFVGSPGSSTIPAGDCAGTELDLSVVRQWRTLRTDQNGDFLFSPTLPAQWCGRSFQALDRSCHTSNVGQLP
jgi:hypothetical protein